MIRRLKAWRARRRWQREQPAREAWVTLRDPAGNVVASVPTVLAPGEPGQWVNQQAVEFKDLPAGTVSSLRMVDADGRQYDYDF